MSDKFIIKMKCIKCLLLFGLILCSLSSKAYDNMELDGIIYGNFYYNTGNSWGLIDVVGCTNVPENLTIPTFVDYKSGLTKRNCCVETIAEDAFKNCTILRSVQIPSRYIKSGAFDNCTNLKDVYFSANGYGQISSLAFNGCNSLENIYEYSLQPEKMHLDDDAFDEETFKKAALHVPGTAKDAYKNTDGWKKFKNVIGIYNMYFSITGGGSITCGNTTITKSSEMETEEGSPITLSFIPNKGYRLSSVKIDGVEIISQLEENRYVIDNLSSNINIETIFEKITSYSINLLVSEYGYIQCDAISFYGHVTKLTNKVNGNVSINVEPGGHVRIYFYPNDGCCLSQVNMEGSDVTEHITDNYYDLSDIYSDISFEICFAQNPPKKYSLSIETKGNGVVLFDNTELRNITKTYSVLEGSETFFSFIPDLGSRIKSVKLNDTDVTTNVTNNQYTISSISGDTSLEVEFEAIPSTTYILSIKATGNGSASYDGTTIRSKTSSFTVNERTSATISFTPDAGYRIKSVKVNSSDVTSSVSNNSYTISSISANTTLEVEFEAIPPTTYILSIKATGNGSASYGGMTIRSKTSSFTVNEGTSATISFTPDAGYRIKSVKVNSSDVTSSIVNNQHTISNITANMTVEVTFEPIPPTTYSLNITVSGNGSVSFNGTTIRSKTTSFTANEGTSVSISITPDNGYRVKSVKENNTDVTSYVSNGKYSITSISRDTNIEVEFEAIPPTTYSLSITASGNGFVTYNGTTIKNDTQSFTVNEGTSATVTFSPDNGYRIASVKVNNTNVTSSIVNNQHTISNITANMTVEVTFEPIPPTTYSLNITVSGNGSVSFNGTTIRSKTTSFTANEGTSVSISITPDNGYRVKSVKENNTDVTSYVSNGKYSITSISRDTNIEVEFEAIPPTTYSLNITASGNGSVSYSGTAIRGKSQSFTINEGTSATVTFSPDSGNRIASVKVNNTDVTSKVSNNSYTISNISANTTLEVEFEAINYALSISATGNGTATYNNTEVRGSTKTFTVNQGSSATVSFTPENGNSLNSVKVNGTDVTSKVTSSRYTISNIRANTTLEVTFIEDITSITAEGVSYKVVSQSDKTINLASGDYGQVLTVPTSVTSNDKTWKIVGIEQNALKGNTELAAIIWNPSVAFNAEINNPNLLLYVKDVAYAPTTIQNIVVNNTAEKIVLTEAASDNNFYCPQAFTARQISYTHHYNMQTGVEESRGWETIALPFDVQTITHENKGNIKAFANWNHADAEKPFWLYELTGSGFVEASNIKANTPYIISMPNHPRYDSEWLLKGTVTFAASNVTVNKTEDVNKPTYSDRTFIPCFATKESDAGIYSLNVNNDFEKNTSGMTEGSKFVLNMRKVHPFEAYMTTTTASNRAIGIFDGMSTDIRTIENMDGLYENSYYDLQGRKTIAPTKKGVYIKNRKKVIIK